MTTTKRRRSTTRRRKTTFLGRIKNGWRTAVNRWKAKTPQFFGNAIKIALVISGTALAIHTAISQGGAAEPQWWTDIYPYLIGVPAGMAAMAKFTQTYDTPKKSSAKKKQTKPRGTINNKA